jgi:hypothetical protein
MATRLMHTNTILITSKRLNNQLVKGGVRLAGLLNQYLVLRKQKLKDQSAKAFSFLLLPLSCKK